MSNRGTGAGGKNTTKNGSAFEQKTSIEQILYEHKFIMHKINKNKCGYFLTYETENIQIIFTQQTGFKTYLMNKFNVDKTQIYRCPDEAFIIYNKITDTYNIKILEKKNQNCEGTVEDKLKNGAFNRREYELMINPIFNVTIDYAFCVSSFLQNKLQSKTPKYININKILLEDNINIFYGDNNNYFTNILNWIGLKN